MATSPVAYRETPANAEKIQAPRFDVSELIDGSDLPRRLRHTLRAMFEIAFGKNKPVGREILLFPALKGIQMRAQVCERTARYHIRALEKLGILELYYSANSRIRPGYFRHTATYRLRADLLKPRPTYENYKLSLPIAKPKAAQSVKAADAAGPVPDARQAPAPPATKRATSSPIAPALTSRQRKKLVGFISDYVEGCKGDIVLRTGEGYYVDKDDPLYREPLPRDAAIVKACELMCKTDGVSLERALEAAAQAGFVMKKGQA